MDSVPSKLVVRVTERRERVRNSLKSYIWAPIHLMIACFIYSELINGFIHGIPSSSYTRTIILGIELLTMVIFAGNITFHLYQIVWLKFIMDPIELSGDQMQLFRVYPKEVGFRLKSEKPVEVSKQEKVSKTPKFSLSPQNSLGGVSSAENSFNSSFGTSMTYGSGGMETRSNSWWYQGHVEGRPSGSEVGPRQSVRKRSSKLGSDEDQILSTDSLSGYLNKFQEKQVRMEEIARHESNASLLGDHVMSLSNLSNGSGRSPSKYQAADDSVHISGSDNDMSVDSSSFSPPRARDGMMSLLGINESRLNQCVENIRTWISRTILSRIVEEIDRVNGQLRAMGFVDVIGDAGLSSLKQMAQLKSSEIPSLQLLIPYLDLSTNQEYLIGRIRELSRGGCISGFNWNSGCSHRNKSWSEELPTDSSIIMHIFCCYMDSRLPAAPNCPEGRSFTSQYFRQFKASRPVPDSSGTSPKTTSPKTTSGYCILETKVNPPQYSVIYKDVDVCEIPGGRNNIFYALILFLHCIRSKNHSLLGFSLGEQVLVLRESTSCGFWIHSAKGGILVEERTWRQIWPVINSFDIDDLLPPFTIFFKLDYSC